MIFSDSLMSFKDICQLEKESLKGLATVLEVFSLTISVTVLRGVKNIYTHYLMHYIRIVRQVTGLLLNNLCKNTAKKSIWKFTDIFPNEILNFLNVFFEHGKIIADYTKNIERISQLLCRNVIVERLSMQNNNFKFRSTN